MSADKLEYSSEELQIFSRNDTIETKTINGLTCIWKGEPIGNKSIKYSWQFNWNEMLENVESFVGHIQVRRTRLSPVETTRFDVKLTKQNQIIDKVVANTNLASFPCVAFDYCLVPLYDLSEKYSLEIDGKKLHVNKAFLSFHSDYFTALFSSNYKEGQMDEIPIEDGSFEDFGRLLSVIYPDSVFPTDKTIEKLLELADRFLMKSVIRHVEHHLLCISAIKHEKMISLADKYYRNKKVPTFFSDAREMRLELLATPTFQQPGREIFAIQRTRLLACGLQTIFQ